MKLDRAQLKLTARGSMADALPSAKLVTLVYLLLTSVLTTVVQTAMGDPFNTVTELINQGYDPQWALYNTFTGVSLPLILFISILLGLFTLVMNFGYTAYCIRLSRKDETAGIGTLLEGFSLVGKVILTRILVTVFIMLWTLALAVPFAILLGIIFAVSMGSTGLAMVLFFVLYVAYFIGVLYFALRYILADYTLFDDPQAGCLEAIRRSKELMTGHKLEYVVLCLSFLGWILLLALLGGIGGAIGAGIGALTGSATGAAILGGIVGFVVPLPLTLWLNPYMGCTYAHYYNYLSGYDQRREESNPAGNFPYL